MNRNIQFAASMFEALRSSGLVYSNDKQTPYKTFHLSGEQDYIQYPLQTMDFSSGDLDELGILFASCLESIGIETALLPVLCTADDIFFGLSMADFSKGFAKAFTIRNSKTDKCCHSGLCKHRYGCCNYKSP